MNFVKKNILALIYITIMFFTVVFDMLRLHGQYVTINVFNIIYLLNAIWLLIIVIKSNKLKHINTKGLVKGYAAINIILLILEIIFKITCI